MRVPKILVGGFLLGLLIVCAAIFFSATPVLAAGETCSNGNPSPCAEDPQLTGCVLCHSIRITAGNRDGTARVITGATGSTRHIDDPKIVDWTSIVSAMISKGSPADLQLTSAYLNTNYCTGCTGVIVSSPVVINLTDTSASITWTTSLNGFGDGPADSVVFFGTSPTTLTGQSTDPTMTGLHSVSLTGLTPSTKYYFQFQSTGADGKTVKYVDTYSFRTKPCPTCGGTTTYAYVANEGSNTISVVNVDTGALQTTIPVDETLFSIVASPDGKTVYASTYYSNISGTYIYIIDTATNAIKSKNLITPPTPAGTQLRLAVSPDGQYLYGAHWPSYLLALSATDLAVIKETYLPDCSGGGCSGIAVSGDGAIIYVVAGSYFSTTLMIDAASAIDPTAETTVTPVTLPGNQGAEVVAAGPDGRGWIPGFYGGSGFSMVQTDGTASTVAGMNSGYGVVVTKVGDQVFGTQNFNYNGDFRVGGLDTATMKVTLSPAGTFGTYMPYGIAVTDDGAKVLVTARCLTDPCQELLYILDSINLSAIGTVPVEIHPNKIAVAKVGLPPAPDVVMTDVTPNAAAVSIGNTLSVTDTVKNQGAGSTDISILIGYRLSSTPNYDDPFAVVISTMRAAGPLAAGETDTGTTNLLIPGATAAGFYYVCAKADASSSLAESDADNNVMCSTATVQVVQPDLAMTAVTPNTGAVTPGGTLSVTDTVQNQGVAPTVGSLTIGYSLSPNTTYGDGDDIPITTTRVVGPLAAGGSSTATTNLLIPSSLPSGTYHVCAKADSGNAVGESNEANNSLCSTAMVGGPVIDLIMSAVSTTATTAAPGGNVTLSNTAKNQGSASAGSFVIAFHLSTNTTYGDGDDIAFTTTRTVTSLGAGALSTASTSLTVPLATALGNYYICATADSANAVTEGDETNNSRCTTGTVQVTRPDLIVTAVTPASGTVSASGTLAVSNSVKNQGIVAAGSSVVGFRLSVNSTYGDGDDIAIVTTRTINTLAAGATSTASTTLTIPNTTPPGTYYVCAKADSAGAVAELDETNNTLCSGATVIVPQSDLIVSVASTTATILAPGGSLTLSNTVQNTGGFPAGSFTVAFHLSSNTTFGDGDDVAFTTTRSVTSLASGATNTATTGLTIPAAAPLGTYYICVMADSASTVGESNETNNSLCTSTTVQVTRPDLIMTAVTPNASTVNQGAALSVTNTVQNQGLLTTGVSFRVGFHLSTNTTYGDGDDVAIATTRTVTALAAGASSSATTSLTIPATTPPGDYYVCAMGDSLAQVVETDETNNTLCSSGTVSVPPADLVMTAASTTATTVNKGANFSLSNGVKNQGGSKAGAFVVAFHLSTNTTYGDGDDVVITQTRSITSLAIGATSSASTTLTVPSSTSSGTYYVCANADSNNTVAEGDETNNPRCTTTTINVP
jgi:YVTN family beta-propeller protein